MVRVRLPKVEAGIVITVPVLLMPAIPATRCLLFSLEGDGISNINTSSTVEIKTGIFLQFFHQLSFSAGICWKWWNSTGSGTFEYGTFAQISPHQTQDTHSTPGMEKELLIPRSKILQFSSVQTSPPATVSINSHALEFPPMVKNGSQSRNGL